MAASISNGSISVLTSGVRNSTESIKYPEQFNNGAALLQEEQCKIFVGRLVKSTNDESLRAYFSKFGQIADIVIAMHRVRGEPSRFAFVTFTTPEAVTAVHERRKKGGHFLDGKVIVPIRAVRQSLGWKSILDMPEKLKIYVGGIDINTTEDDLMNYFSTFGKVVATFMPYHRKNPCPIGYAFVGFKSIETVMTVTKDRYHQINGKTVEVNCIHEQAQKVENRDSNPHMQHSGLSVGTIGSVGGGLGAANGNLAAAAGQKVLIPQVINGQIQYVAAQIPAASAPQQYVFDSSTNTYQLPSTASVLGAAAGASAGAYNPYAGIQLMTSTVGTTAGSPLCALQMVRGGMTASMISALAAGAGVAGQLGSVYSSETSTLGPSRAPALDGGGAGGTLDSKGGFSNAASMTGGKSVKVSEGLTIFVSGICIGTTEDDVKNYFSIYGKVVAADMSDYKKGFAFVSLTSVETVVSVTKHRYHQINGKTVEVRRFTGGSYKWKKKNKTGSFKRRVRGRRRRKQEVIEEE